MNVESAVLERYSEGAREKQDELCCPVAYDSDLLKLLPPEIVEKDYGCGDPSRYVREGDVVLDLGSGSGKVCYMAAQLVGENGRVIGVDMNDDMLALARKYKEQMAERLGGDRVRFVKGRIQDLALDIEAMDKWLAQHPVTESASLAAFEECQKWQRETQPMIANGSVDLVLSNCVLNLVRDEDKRQLVNEIFRVLRPSGRIAISDIVSDEAVSPQLKEDTDLWSGCVAGAFQEKEMLETFRDAGFLAICIDRWSEEPWRVIDGIEFRAVTITGIKGEGTECLDRGHAVIYRGPFSSVRDDEDHEFPRGERMAVCERTFRYLTEGPCRDFFIGISPQQEREPVPWCAPPGTRRSPAETRGGAHIDSASGKCCC